MQDSLALKLVTAPSKARAKHGGCLDLVFQTYGSVNVLDYISLLFSDHKATILGVDRFKHKIFTGHERQADTFPEDDIEA
ncbi:hypothetical protein V5799_005552, partial [Amblyomma americanum]